MTTLNDAFDDLMTPAPDCTCGQTKPAGPHASSCPQHPARVALRETARTFRAGWDAGRYADLGPMREDQIDAACAVALNTYLASTDPKREQQAPEQPAREKQPAREDDRRRESLANAAVVEVAGFIVKAAADPTAVTALACVLFACTDTAQSLSEQRRALNRVTRSFNDAGHLGVYFEDFWPPVVYRLWQYLDAHG